MTPQFEIELFLAVAAVLLLGRDLRRAWRDALRRPLSLPVAGPVAALLIGTPSGGPLSSPWLLLLPAGILAWEVARGWRQTPRCHVREAGVAAFAVALLFAVAGLAIHGEGIATAFLALAATGGMLGLALILHSRRSEPRPWRIEGPAHYERAGGQRKRG